MELHNKQKHNGFLELTLQFSVPILLQKFIQLLNNKVHHTAVNSDISFFFLVVVQFQKSHPTFRFRRLVQCVSLLRLNLNKSICLCFTSPPLQCTVPCELQLVACNSAAGLCSQVGRGSGGRRKVESGSVVCLFIFCTQFVQSGEKFCSNHCTASPSKMLASSGVSVPPSSLSGVLQIMFANFSLLSALLIRIQY